MTKDMTNIAEVWRELFVAWLYANGIVCIMGPTYSKIGGSFVYCGRKNRFAIYVSGNTKILELDIAELGLGWFLVNLSLAIDPCDPSFDPNTFFEPIKRKLDKK